MKIAIVAPSSVPYVLGGSERAALGLLDAINELTPHDADLIKLPSKEHSFPDLVDSYRRFAQLDLDHFDAVISTKYPSWMVRHPCHIVYMQHPLRGLYDTYDSMGFSREPDAKHHAVREFLHLLDNLVPGTHDGWKTVLDRADKVIATLGREHPVLSFPGPLVRRLVHWLDRDALDPSRIVAHFAISKTVAGRPNYFPSGSSVRALPLPSSLKGLHRGPFVDLFTVSRLDGAKRIDLLISAMRHVKSSVSLRIAGAGPIEQDLRHLAATDARVEFLGRIRDEQLADEYSRALAVPFVPLDEDLGLVTFEAHLSGKPVITCTDSGGVAELVAHGVTGFVVPPNPAALAGAIDLLAQDRTMAGRMGEAGAATSSRITWESVVKPLVAAAGLRFQRRSSARVPSQTGRVVVLSTYGISPALGGGQIRVNRLLQAVAHRYPVDVVAFDDGSSQLGSTIVAPGLRQVVAARSDSHRRREAMLAGVATIPIGDIAASLFAIESPIFVQAARAALRNADLAILAHPYLMPILDRFAADLPFVYDAHNAEYLMKQTLLSTSAAATELAQCVRLVEQAAVRRAEAVTVCSDADKNALLELTPTLAEFRLVPNGADVDAIKFVTGPERTANRDRWLEVLSAMTSAAPRSCLALFVGSYHPPNIQAAEFIIRLAGTMPDVAFVLAGSHCAAFENWRVPENVILRGVVSRSELHYLLSSADVAINPMSSGAGTNLKLLEYLAAGVPAVSTRMGIRGLDLGPDELSIVELWAFSDGLARVLDDRDGAAERAQLGRLAIEQRYDWRKIADDFARVVDDVLQAV